MIAGLSDHTDVSQTTGTTMQCAFEREEVGVVYFYATS
jgi:hypothetical protein